MPLGRECSISVNGTQLLTTRRVSVTRSAAEIECAIYGSSQFAAFFPGPETISIEVEVLGVGDALLMAQAMDSTTTVQVSGTNVGGVYRVFSMSVDEPLDGPVSYVATLKRSVV